MNLTLANKKQFFIGLISLIIGFIFYFSFRPDMSSYLQMKFPVTDMLFGNHKNLLGILGSSFPEFMHPFSFSLIGMGLVSRTRKSRRFICLIFFLINIFFELGQKYSSFVASYLPGWLDKYFVLENTRNFFVLGRFSAFDILAIFLGSIMAFTFAEIISQKGGYPNEKLERIS